MPELPEVEIITRQLRARLRGRILRRVEICDPKIALAGKLTGCRIAGVRRRAKLLIFDFSRDRHLLVHLRMTGWWEFARPAKYRFALHAGKVSAYFADSRRFGTVELVGSDELGERLRKLGPEPFESDWPAVWQSRRAIKVALLDQALVAGIGNIYACEGLWRAGISPRRKACRLTVAERRRLQRAVVAAMRQGIAYGPRIFVVQKFFAYDRAGLCCRRCGGTIGRMTQAQRSTFWCRGCQR